MNRVWLILRAHSDAIFTATAATLGGHEGLSHIPGANLLGWAAARLYSTRGFDAFTAFHSGKLRFGDGWPLTHSGAPAFPLPQCWRERKRAKGGIARMDAGGGTDGYRIGDVLNFQFENPFTDDDGNTIQAETIKNAFAAADGTAHRPVRGWRGKTAIEPGSRRAALGQFFGYDHIKAGAGFAALLEADEGPAADAVFATVVELFHKAASGGQMLRLGRSAGSEFGGEFSLRVEASHDVPWQPSEPVLENSSVHQGRRIVSFWCLSDLALEDPNTGAPIIFPAGDVFGLRGSELDRRRSFVLTRRYAPFNKTLGRRDLDRVVIAGGSVLAFAAAAAADETAISEVARRGIGLYRENGLGRVWVNPPMLRTAVPQFERSVCFASLPARQADVARLPAWAAMGREVARWAGEQGQAAAGRQGAEGLATAWQQSLDWLLAALRSLNRDTPTPAQWSSVAEACRRNRRSESALRRALIGETEGGAKGHPGICGRGVWEEVAPGAEPSTLRKWIEARLREDVQGGISRADALALLAGLAQKQAASPEERR